jgi:hypothetical protein
VMRICRPWLWAIFAALFLPPSALPAQTVYRCASTYSDRPCPGGATIDVDDSRSTAQKAQTDAATVQATRLANQIQAARLVGERRLDATTTRQRRPDASRAARAIKAKATKINKLNTPNGRKKMASERNKANAKPGEPAYFTATARPDGNTAATRPGQ